MFNDWEQKEQRKECAFPDLQSQALKYVYAPFFLKISVCSIVMLSFASHDVRRTIALAGRPAPGPASASSSSTSLPRSQSWHSWRLKAEDEWDNGNDGNTNIRWLRHAILHHCMPSMNRNSGSTAPLFSESRLGLCLVAKTFEILVLYYFRLYLVIIIQSWIN